MGKRRKKQNKKTKDCYAYLPLHFYVTNVTTYYHIGSVHMIIIFSFCILADDFAVFISLLEFTVATTTLRFGVQFNMLWG